MDISRRRFVGGLAKALPVFAVPELFVGCRSRESDSRPLLRFGVVSDVHCRLNKDLKHLDKGFDTVIFEHALRWFDAQGVDAVAVCGDLTDKGTSIELLQFAATWQRVFPGDRASDGRKVERILVTGNHDWEGWRYGKWWKTAGMSEDMRRRVCLCEDVRRIWREAFHEEYQSAFHKVVKGYDFVGANWEGAYHGADEDAVADASPVFSGLSPKPDMPVFYFQHPHPKDTCYGPWAWGRDKGIAAKAIAKFPSVVAFSGHSHYSLTDERSIWNGAFTSVGAGSLRYCSTTYHEFAPDGYENTPTAGPDRAKINSRKMMPSFRGFDSHQGLLVSVYGDRIVYDRRDFANDLALDEPWVQYLARGDQSRPCGYVERARTAAAPQFAAEARLKVERGQAARRGAKKVKVDCLTLTIPCAGAVASARPLDYCVEVVVGERRIRRRVLASGFHRAKGDERSRVVTTCVFAIEDFPPGEVLIEVTPRSSLGVCGRKLSIGFKGREAT